MQCGKFYNFAIRHIWFHKLTHLKMLVYIYIKSLACLYVCMYEYLYVCLDFENEDD